jgi:predicted PurR-regulated permease PerM
MVHDRASHDTTGTVMAAEGSDISGLARVDRAGRTSWAMLGVLGVVAVIVWLASLVSLVVVPVVLPATLLVPAAAFLRRRGVPSALAAVLTLLGGIAFIGLLIGGMVPLVAAELPELAASASEGIADLDAFLQSSPFGIEVGGLSALLDMASEQLPDAGEVAGQALSAAAVAFDTVTGTLLMIVLVFFYLKDGRRLSEGVVSLAPARLRARFRAGLEQSWTTLGAYFRGQLLVALFDAVGIGIGLLLLGVPLALPLSVLVLFGGLFPIVGAVTTGALAVLVALADGGLVVGLAVLAVVLGVQQLEGNVLEPLILGRVINLHPIVVLLSIAAGALLLGILGAFLAVPVAAIVARLVDNARSGDEAEEISRRPGTLRRSRGGAAASRARAARSDRPRA